MTDWIAIKERPAPTGVGVLVHANGTITAVCFEPGWITLAPHGFSGYEWKYDFEREDVTHWMPLPAPPTPQSS